MQLPLLPFSWECLDVLWVLLPDPFTADNTLGLTRPTKSHRGCNSSQPVVLVGLLKAVPQLRGKPCAQCTINTGVGHMMS
jgi:hypothetical protein